MAVKVAINISTHAFNPFIHDFIPISYQCFDKVFLKLQWKWEIFVVELSACGFCVRDNFKRTWYGSFVRPPSVCGIDYLRSYCMDFLQVLVVASPGPYFFFIFIRIFVVFINMGPYGSENFKPLLLLQIAAESFQTFPEFSSQWSSWNYFRDF